MKLKLFVPSKMRSTFIPKSVALSMSDFMESYAVVPRGEGREYRKYLDDTPFEVVETDVVGLANTRNWIIETLWGDADAIVMMDDDIELVLWALDYPMEKVPGHMWGQIIDEGIELAKVVGVPMYSIRTYPGNTKFVNRLSPIKLRGKMFNCIIAILDRSVRFNPVMNIMDDFELSMRTLHRYGVTLTDGRYLVGQKEGRMGTVSGGISEVRTRKNLDADKQYLRDTFGSFIDRYFDRKGVYGKN